MGKWAARLAQQVAADPSAGTDRTDTRGLVAVLAVAPPAGAGRSRPSADVDRRARLLRWGWPAQEAERLATRLARRDLENDDRVSCGDCKHYRPGRCCNHRRAGLGSTELGRDLAAMLQRCSGFERMED